MLPAWIVATQSPEGRALTGGVIIVMGLGVLAWNRTDASRRVIKRISQLYFGERAGDAFAVIMHYVYYVGAAFFLAVGICGVISGILGCGGGSCGAAELGG
ncbi:MAG TPA: hypothetical protein VHT27_08525 [Solirubrobacteraceae bacterium]|jgi:hypothetical protein|nr:hypothetical protein [Solirubrobacteraceae bacterium]